MSALSLPSSGPHFNIFTITPRTLAPEAYWENIDEVGKLCQRYRLTGPLLFTGNDTFVEPWVCAQALIERYRLSPLIAVNPLYMHPFTVAKMISSMAYVYGQKVFLNMVTGTAVNHAHQLNCYLDHDQKYDQMREAIEIIQQLIEREEKAVSFDGDYYQVEGLSLCPAIPSQLRPDYFIAGHSEKANEVRDATGAIGMKMLMPELAGAVTGDRGIHFGVVTRATQAEAWVEAKKRFPDDPRGRRKLEISMKNTESVWKKRLKFAADAPDQNENGYWLGPFRNFQADCPYFVGSHAELADLVVKLRKIGVTELILDIPKGEVEFENAAIAFEQAESILSKAEAGTAESMIA
ncbi:MAG: LLM class flavin-dependent oxidoreductase [Verrucomicrobiota bacterium]